MAFAVIISSFITTDTCLIDHTQTWTGFNLHY